MTNRNVKKIIISIAICLLSFGNYNFAYAADLKNTDFNYSTYTWKEQDEKTYLQTKVNGTVYNLKRATKNPESAGNLNDNAVFSEENLAYITDEFLARFADTEHTDIASTTAIRKTRIAITFRRDSEDKLMGNLFFADYHDNHKGWRGLVDKFGNTTTLVKDPDNVAPGAMDKISSGKLTGELIPLGEWQTPVKDVLEDGHSTVWLEDEGGNYISTKNEIQINSAGDRYFYDIDFKTEITGEGLYPYTVYAVRIRQQDGWTNCTGDTNNGNGICKNTWTATTSFSFDKTGKVKVLNKNPLADSCKDEEGKPEDGCEININSMTWDKGINLTVKESVSSPLLAALNSAMEAVISWIDTTVKFLSGWIQSALENTDVEDTKEAWYAVRTISITLLLLGLIIVAFANVLNIDISQYGAQRMIPRFVMNIVLAFFSFLIVKILLEVSNILSMEFQSYLSKLDATTAPLADFSIENISPMDAMGSFGSLLLLIIILVGLIIAMVYLFLLLIVRIVVIKFLVVMGPVALVLGIMPFTESQLKQWWSELFKWVFMGPAVMGLLLVGSIILNSMQKAQGVSLSITNTSFLDNFQNVFYLLTAAAAYFMAAQIPLQMGGKVMAAWDKKVKGGMKWTGGKTWDGTKNLARRTGYPDAWKQTLEARKNRFEKNIERKGSLTRAKIGEKGRLGRMAAGYRDESEINLEKHKIKEGQLSEIQKGYEGMSPDQIRKDLFSTDELRQQAALRTLAASPIGLVGKDKKEAWDKQEELINKFVDQDANLSGNLFKEQLGTMAVGNFALRGVAVESIGKKNPTELKDSMIKALNQTMDEAAEARRKGTLDPDSGLGKAEEKAKDVLGRIAPKDIEKYSTAVRLELKNSADKGYLRNETTAELKTISGDASRWPGPQTPTAGKSGNPKGPQQTPPGEGPGF